MSVLSGSMTSLGLFGAWVDEQTEITTAIEGQVVISDRGVGRMPIGLVGQSILITIENMQPYRNVEILGIEIDAEVLRR